MRWFVVDLGDALLAQNKLVELQTQLTTAWQGAGQPQEMLAGYCYRGSGLHCQVDVFISEALQYVVNLPAAKPCYRPPPDFQSLLGDSPSAMA
ncbi:hypothetical protein [Bowmanella yangjiangensis]|uniref:Uncharacterized protein n=1 Tax=Bowmanella yangjiangensis TaxID=2811230 RepID=A0ABS3CQK9_9ALTE|nr:hypothetical protein [Bowmanella yangjiangensis]MBN7818590.1 hypothetical protein [Bowmanella yangjiangensis]